MLLAIDTSTTQVGIALLDSGQLAVESIWNSRVHHTVELAPAVAQLLERAGARPADVEAIAVAIGPGSFTALRVGLAFAKGFALARRLPLIGVPTLDILAAAQPPTDSQLVAVLQAGRSRIAVNWYRYSAEMVDESPGPSRESEGFWLPTGEPQVTTVDQLAKTITKPTVIAGELDPEERQRLARKRARVILAPLHLCVRRPSVLAELGWRRLAAGQLDESAGLSPLYLHIGEPLPA